MKKWLKLSAMVLGFCVLSACSNYQAQYQDAKDKNACIAGEIKSAKENNQVVKLDNNFYATDVYHSGANPSWLNTPVNIHANQLPLNLLMNRLMPANSVGVQYESSVSSSKPITINYHGALRGALDKIASQTGYAYDISDSTLSWSGYVTKTFDISFMPGSSQYLVGQKQGDSMNTMTTGGGSNVATGQGTDSQFSSLQANLSVWKDLDNAIKEMLSSQGKVMVSESTTTVTVRDHASNVQEIADYLASMNRDLSKEVLLQVQVLQITLNTNFNLGINWNLAYQNASSMASGSNLGSNPISNSLAGTPGISAGIVSGPFANTKLLISALGQQGTVANVTNPEVVTLNNQVAQIDISRQTTYLASSTNTLTAASGTASGFSQTTLNPGVVSTGFKLYILPKILMKNIYLEVSSELSTLQSLQTLTSGGSSISSPGSSSLQLPVVDGKHFNLRSVVPSGSTLIIAGFNSVDSVAGTNSSFGVKSGANTDQKDVQTILLITPTILGK
jgi:type IVB pilus formation R64 PilN family outer membrane protein